MNTLASLRYQCNSCWSDTLWNKLFVIYCAWNPNASFILSPNRSCVYLPGATFPQSANNNELHDAHTESSSLPSLHSSEQLHL